MKHNNTANAADLLERLKQGPLFSDSPDGSPLTAEGARQQCQVWINNYLLPALHALSPDIAAATEQPESKAKGKRIWSRAAIVDMAAYNPDKYQRCLPEIKRAYAEGRVK